MKSPDRTHDVVLLKAQGMSRRAIARALDMNRKTVSKLLLEHERRRATGGLALSKPVVSRRLSKLDSHRERIAELLKSFPDITAQRVFEELRDAGFDGGYTIVKTLIRKRRPKPSPTISMPVDQSGPGELAESDWASYSVEFSHAPTERVQCFGYVLCYSRRKFYHFFERSDIHSLMQGHVLAFERFGGLAAKCKYDGQKAVILGWEGRQALFNLRFLAFATYYELQPVACRPRKPNDKPRVERSFWELERSFFNGRRFRDRDDLAAQLHDWMDRVADLRGHDRGQPTPLDRFAIEKPYLKPLPAHPYDTARVVYRVCDAEGYVAWDGNRYSVPYEHVTEFLPLRVTRNELFVYAADLSLVASHELRPRGAGVMAIEPAHRPRHAKAGAPLEQLRRTFAEFGDRAAVFLAELERVHGRSAGYHARRILALRERFRTDQLVKALAHALEYGAFEHRSIERILEASSSPRRLDEYTSQAWARKLDARLQGFTEPRDLSEYDVLPAWSSSSGSQGDLPCQEPNEDRQSPEDRNQET